MSIKYECCYCHKIFPAKEAIDGYKKGFNVGFLCPNCGKNIQAGLEARAQISPEQLVWTLIAFILFLPVIFTRGSESTYFIFEYSVNISTLFFACWIFFILILLVVKPSLFTQTTFYTEKVNPD